MTAGLTVSVYNRLRIPPGRAAAGAAGLAAAGPAGPARALRRHRRRAATAASEAYRDRTATDPDGPPAEGSDSD